MKIYHDTEWGIPVHDDRKMFEHLTLEVMQCGLNWNMMLQKREVFRRCFDDFDFDRVAGYDEADVNRILNTEGMIRSRRKIQAVINNAVCCRSIRADFGTFCDFFWSFSGGRTILYNGHGTGRVPVSNGLSEKISRELKRQGFKFVGPVTVYSHLQACGIINDHDRDCECYRRIVAEHPTVDRRGYLEKYQAAASLSGDRKMFEQQPVFHECPEVEINLN